MSKAAQNKQTAENGIGIGIGKGKAGPGRPSGLPNKTTKVLKDAILLAAETVGSDGEGTDGLTGYLVMVAKSDAKAFSSLLGRVLPLQVVGDKENPIITEIRQRIIDPKAGQ